MEDSDIIREFVIESSENLDRLVREMVDLEVRPDDAQLLASVFRTIHTVKGTCGFLGFATLEKITHHAENILSQVRNCERPLTPLLVSLILETADCIRVELSSIESSSNESGENYLSLVERLESAYKQNPAATPEAQPAERVGEINTAQESAALEEPLRAQDPAQPKAGVCGEVDKSGARTHGAADSTIRVDVGLLNKLMNLVGELVLARNQVLQFSARSEDPALAATSQRLNLITTELQEGVMKTRMQPIGVIWNSLPRVVRDLSAACGKQIHLEMDGSATELDKTIIEAIKDPLTHIVRNCCDHGIEAVDRRTLTGKSPQGKLILRAFHEGGNVNIEIEDDGAGIHPQKIKSAALAKGILRPEEAERLNDRELMNLVFVPGFSTAERISNISGRGVGMDVVKTNIEKIGGTVDLTSRPGLGTCVKIKIPLTLAIIPGLVVEAGGYPFVIAQINLLELLRLEGKEAQQGIEWISGAPVYRRRGKLLPLTDLNQVLQLSANGRNGLAGAVISIVVLEAEGRQFGLIVDSINDTQEIVVKPLGSQLKWMKGYAGATIMGDGKVALILDIPGIAELARVTADRSELDKTSEPTQDCEDRPHARQMLLLFRAGGVQRMAIPLSLVARLEVLPASSVESAAGCHVVQYRGQILPLISLSSQFGLGEDKLRGDTISAIVFTDRGRDFGLLIDEFLDVVDEEISAKKPSSHALLLGSAVVGGKVTDFLDLETVLRNFERGWFSGRAASTDMQCVLIADSAPFSRKLMRNYIEMAGLRVLEASSAGEALEILRVDKADIVAASLDLPHCGALELIERVRADSKHRAKPVIAFSQGSRSERTNPDLEAKFTFALYDCDRSAMLSSLKSLSSQLTSEREEVASGHEQVAQ